jgi:hypothetical protein
MDYNQLLQWTPLNVITSYVIIQLLQSNLPILTSSKITRFTKCSYLTRSLILIIGVMPSVSLGPKVITLTSFHFTLLHLLTYPNLT